MRKIFAGHECTTAQRCGWGGVQNGELLRLAESQFDLFITSDQGILYQQNLMGRRISILMLSTNKLRPFLAASKVIQAAVDSAKPGDFRELLI
jgi:hypothetical protein